MSGQLRVLKNRIRGVENTEKITKAMEMVAASKLKRYQKLREQATPYMESLEGVLNRLLHADIPPRHPLLESRAEKGTALLVITSDTGLCGSYNQNLIEEAKKFLRAKTHEPLLIGVGKSGVSALSRAGHACFQSFGDNKALPFEFVATEIALLFEELFSGKKVDAVYAVYPQFTGKSAYRIATKKILPLEFEAPEDYPGEASGPYILEPSRDALFARLIPLVFAAKIRMIFVESMIAEHTARMNAMYQASENAKELIDTLVLLRNKIRQAGITNELIEIVSGSKALKN